MHFTCTLGLAAANVEYSNKVSSNSSTPKVLHTLAWNIDDLSHLSDECSKIIVELQCIQDIVQEAIESSNIPRRLKFLRERFLPLLQEIYRF